MVNKSLLLRIFITTFLVCLAPALPGESNFFIDSESRFIQRFSWRGSDYALQYEAIIEKEEDGEYVEALNKFSDYPFIEVSLSPGKYRLRVIPYDFRNMPGESTAWRAFEIRPALRPLLFSFTPPVFYLEKDMELTLNIFGTEFSPNAEMCLRRSDGELIVPDEKEINLNGNHAWLRFNHDQLDEGIYEIHIRNPGGLEVNVDGLIVALFEPDTTGKISTDEMLADTGDVSSFDMFISAAWMPFFPLHEGESFFFDNNPSLAGMAVRFSMISDKEIMNTHLGLEFALSLRQQQQLVGQTSYEAGALTIGVNFLAQKRYPNLAAALNFRAGMGYTLLVGEEAQDAPTLDQHISANFGISFMWLVFDPFYLEAGIDYANYFTRPASGCILPWIAIGFSF